MPTIFSQAHWPIQKLKLSHFGDGKTRFLDQQQNYNSVTALGGDISREVFPSPKFWVKFQEASPKLSQSCDRAYIFRESSKRIMSKSNNDS